MLLFLFAINPHSCYILFIGTEVSLEATNELLALLAHRGVGCEKASQHDMSQRVINWPPSGLPSLKKTGKINEAELEALKDLGKFQEELESPQTGE